MKDDLMEADLDMQEAISDLRAAGLRLARVAAVVAGPQKEKAAEALARVDAVIVAAQAALDPLRTDISAAYKDYNDAGGNVW